MTARFFLFILLAGCLCIRPLTAEPLYVSHEDFSDYRAGGAAPGSWKLYSEGELVAGLNLSASSRCDIVVVAAGEPALEEWPQMQIRTPLKPAATISVSATQFHTYAAVMDLPEGRRDLELRYINDAVTEDEDRNLYIHSLFIVPHQTNVSIELLSPDEYMHEREQRKKALLDSARLAIENIRKGAVTFQLQDHTGAARTNLTIHIEQLRHAFPWGCAVDDRPFLTNAPLELLETYTAYFTKLFNAGVTGRAVKWKFMQREPGPLLTQPLDAMLDWADELGITMRGHCVFWECSNAVPRWVSKLSDEELRATVTGRARMIGRKYRGRFVDLDVNNEMLHCGFFEQRLGSGIHRQMFHELHAADPGVALYVNDFEILNGKMVEAYREQIDELLASGVPLGGIGIQSHLDDTFDLIKARQVLDQLEDYGLPVKLTELTVRDVPLERQLQIYRDVLTLAFGHHAVDGILQWGFWESLHYRPEAALMREDGTLTPAGQVYTNLVFGEWWSETTLEPDQQGRAHARVFYGDHRISVADSSGQELYATNLQFNAGDIKLTFAFDLPEGSDEPAPAKTDEPADEAAVPEQNIPAAAEESVVAEEPPAVDAAAAAVSEPEPTVEKATPSEDGAAAVPDVEVIEEAAEAGTPVPEQPLQEEEVKEEGWDAPLGW